MTWPRQFATRPTRWTPSFAGLPDTWWRQISPGLPHMRIARALATKSVRTDEALANAIHRYRKTRKIATVAFCTAVAAFGTLVLGSR